MSELQNIFWAKDIQKQDFCANYDIELVHIFIGTTRMIAEHFYCYVWIHYFQYIKNLLFVWNICEMVRYAFAFFKDMTCVYQ